MEKYLQLYKNEILCYYIGGQEVHLKENKKTSDQPLKVFNYSLMASGFN